MIYSNEYPLSASDMTYNYDEHMYVLTSGYVKTKTGVDLALMVQSPYVVDISTAVNNLLNDISMEIYQYVYSYNSRYNNYQEYLMAKSPMAREMIRKALLKQLAYIIRNGKINEFAGTNVSYNQNNASTPLVELRGDRAIHPEAIQVLRQPLEDGTKLLFNGNYDLPWSVPYGVGY